MHMERNSVCAVHRAREAGLSVCSVSGLLLSQKCNGSAEELVG